jgi:seryl-tRNA synthetase
LPFFAPLLISKATGIWQMHDIKWIRENAGEFDAGLARRGRSPLSLTLIGLDEARKGAILSAQKLNERRNALSKEIGAAMAAKNTMLADDLKAEVAHIKTTLPSLEEEAAQAQKNLTAALEVLPNLPLQDVPEGGDESGNVLHHVFSKPPVFNFTPKEHYALGEAMKLMDFEAAAKLSGARFVVLKGALARLERALAAFMLDIHTSEHGYMEVNPPLLVKEHTAYGTGNLPKAAEDMFLTREGFYLTPTAEMSLTNLVANEIIDEKDLPLRMVASTPCFRSEAGSAGRDTRGMLRQHQFQKVELVSIVRVDDSQKEHQRMLNCAEEILRRLELPYRVMTLCAGDMGFAAQKTYDIEVWMPGQNTYREISSCSNCGPFQARRMGARVRVAGDKNLHTLHTLNGSGVAVGRCLIAVMENYQQEDGSVLIPKALLPYMGGLSVIK